jgi:hypothetical protein
LMKRGDGGRALRCETDQQVNPNPRLSLSSPICLFQPCVRCSAPNQPTWAQISTRSSRRARTRYPLIFIIRSVMAYDRRSLLSRAFSGLSEPLCCVTAIQAYRKVSPDDPSYLNCAPLQSSTRSAAGWPALEARWYRKIRLGYCHLSCRWRSRFRGMPQEEERKIMCVYDIHEAPAWSLRGRLSSVNTDQPFEKTSLEVKGRSGISCRQPSFKGTDVR